MEEIFQKASRNKLRFDTTKGYLSVEDVWDLSLQSLDSLAKGVNKQLKEDSEESFISVKSTKNTELELKLEILKAVIAYKLAEKEAKTKRLEKAQKKALIEELIAKKELSGLEQKSLEELQKDLAELEA